MTRFWQVALTSPPYSTLTYRTTDGLPHDLFKAGQRVIAPLGEKDSLRVGMLLEPVQDEQDIPKGVELKPLLWPMELDPLLNAEYLDMVRHLALRQMEPVGRIFASILPADLRKTKIYFEILGGQRRRLQAKELKTLPPSEIARLAALWCKGEMLIRRPSASREQDIQCLLVKDPPWAVRPAAVKQLAILEYLLEHGSVQRRRLLKELGPSAARPLDCLIQRGLVRLGASVYAMEGDGTTCAIDGFDSLECDFLLTDEQDKALRGLRKALASPVAEARLLYGVTGSGKTAVYLELARECLDSGRSVLLLAPEVALACQLHKAACHALPEAKAMLYHGYQTTSFREEAFSKAARSKVPLMAVGTRSALFLPLPRLGLIVLDEEHDSSFKQEERLNYQAKEIAYFRSQQTGGLLVLGSATPDVKSFYASLEGHLPKETLRMRIGSGGVPAIQMVDIRKLKPTEQLMAPESMEALQEALEQGDQAIIMLNRRGYSPLMYCLDCGLVAKCDQCEIGLTYHKGRERLVCHYCGQAKAFPLICPGCGGNHYLPMGEGTERIEETLSAVLPEHIKVLRLDRDSTRRPGRLEDILDAFGRGEAQVLVGTQMLSKGHHFPNVTRVIVADGDLGLNLPDYRAAERTFQLLVQVAGRAGRGDKPGEVFIQTRDPRHYCWEFVKTGNYEGFFERELEVRRRRRYPPFVKLALVRIDYPMDWNQGAEHLTELAQALRRHGPVHGVSILGPAPAPLSFLRGRKRFHCLLKAEDWPSIRSVFGKVRNEIKTSRLRLGLDLDPVNML